MFVPNFSDAKNQIYYSKQKVHPKLPKTREEINNILTNSKYGLSFYSRKKQESQTLNQECDTDMTASEVSKTYNSNNGQTYHQSQHLNAQTSEYIQANHEFRRMQQKTN